MVWSALRLEEKRRCSQSLVLCADLYKSWQQDVGMRAVVVLALRKVVCWWCGRDTGDRAIRSLSNVLVHHSSPWFKHHQYFSQSYITATTERTHSFGKNCHESYFLDLAEVWAFHKAVRPCRQANDLKIPCRCRITYQKDFSPLFIAWKM